MACHTMASSVGVTWSRATHLSHASVDDRRSSLTTRKSSPVSLPARKAEQGRGKRGGVGNNGEVRCSAGETANVSISRRHVIGTLIGTSVTASWMLPMHEKDEGLAAMAAEEEGEVSASSLRVYYGNASGAASYGGYGGNASKQSEAEYIYKVPTIWKERLVSKIEKGTNGTDSEFYNPKKKAEKIYLTYLAGVRQLGPKDAILNNLALSDVSLQDALAETDGIAIEERKDAEGQLYYDYELTAGGNHNLVTVTCKRNKLYSFFVRSPEVDWQRDESMLREIWGSFKTV